ncbi:MAG: type II secretion system protein M [Ahniella sp.]|nr:type II secretion system protein M [Ahniella sp.]
MNFWKTSPNAIAWVLGWGGIVVAVMLFWAFLFQPLVDARKDIGLRVAAAEKDYVWMLGASDRLKQLAPAGSAGTFDRAGKSLLALADQAAQEALLANAIQRMEPASDSRVNVWLERADFDQVAIWLEQMELRYGIRVESFQFDRSSQTGLVDGRLTLVDSVQ